MPVEARRRRRALLLACVLAGLAGCMPSRRDVREAVDLAAQQQDRASTCSRADRCALASPLRTLAAQAQAASTAAAPVHHVLLLESGQDALLARVHLLRAAQRTIQVQSFIFAEDDAGYFVLNELLQAARRGVKVQVLLDQLFSVDDVRLLARLAEAHVNFELRLYNPTFGEARTDPVQFVAGLLCCFSRFNQRMHNKLLLVDGLVGITGGRNFQNRYFDWDPGFNYRDRDVLVAGPAARQMGDSFDAFWRYRKSVPVAALRDVRRWVGRTRATHDEDPAFRLTRAEQIVQVAREAEDPIQVQARLLQPLRRVAQVEYVSDLPDKRPARASRRDLTLRLQRLLQGARERILMQTPYLVLSRRAQQLFRGLQARPQPPQVVVSTNSLASTDAFYVYALSHKYKRRYLRDFGFRIHEFKPFPASAPIDLEATGALDGEVLGGGATEALVRSGSAGRRGREPRGPLPLKRAGLRVGLHAKSMVIDGEVGMVGTHNFDPRSDRLNTESALIVYDSGFAAELAAAILRDTQPENAWTIAPRQRIALLSPVNDGVGLLFETLPLFDLWPFRYATSYELKPGCSPLSPGHAEFHDCYEPVGDFPEVGLPLKSIYTRVLTAFGAGLAPFL